MNCNTMFECVHYYGSFYADDYIMFCTVDYFPHCFVHRGCFLIFHTVFVIYTYILYIFVYT